MNRIVQRFTPQALPERAHAELRHFVSPAVYGARYWGEWSQPHGLLRIGAPLRQCGRKGVGLFAFVLAGRNFEEANSLCTYC
jgi:hypothetical protein